MIACRTNRCAVALGAVLLTGAVLTGAAIFPSVLRDVAAQEQSDSDKLRFQQPSGGSANRPIDLRNPRVLRLPGQKEQGQGIEAEALGDVDVGSIGTISGPSALPPDMWQGADRALVETLLAKLPLTARSPAMHDLMRRLLLSAAAMPQGDGSSVSMVAVRLETLLAMGAVDSAIALLDSLPARVDDARIAQARLNAYLLKGDIELTCRLAPNLMRLYPLPDFQKAQILCQLFLQEIDRATLNASLLRETGHDAPTFFAMADAALAARPPELASLPPLTPLLLRMAELSDQPLAPKSLDGANPGMLRAIAYSPAASRDIQAIAAETAEAAGALPQHRLHELYETYEFSPAERETPFSSAAEDGGPRGRALLYQMAKEQEAPAARAAVLQKSWQLSRESGTYFSSVRSNISFLKGLQPRPELTWFAEDAGRALFVAGHRREAAQWLGLALRESQAGDWAAAAAANLWVQARLSGVEGEMAAWRQAWLTSWWAHQKQQDSVVAPGRAGIVYSLLQSLGNPISLETWQAVILEKQRADRAAVPRRVAPASLNAMLRAAQNNQVGATVLFCLMALGEEGPAAASPLSMGAVIDALVRAGLESDARALALEAAVEAGL